MKKFGLGLVKSSVLCTLMLISLQANMVVVGAIESSATSAQLLSYDIEMDDYYGNEKTTECMCDDCVAQRAKEREKAAEVTPYLIYTAIIGTIAFLIYCKIDNKKKSSF